MLATVIWFLLTLGGAAQAQPRAVVVSGVVKDQTGAVLPSAQVTIAAAGSTIAIQSATSDASGTFKFDGVRPGSYEIHAEFPGFMPKTSALTIFPSSIRTSSAR
jgi:protocatechuate 3,4-dioxygenase beta subunit